MAVEWGLFPTLLFYYVFLFTKNNIYLSKRSFFIEDIMAKEYKLSHIICPVHNKPKRISPKGALYCYDCRKDYVNRNRETVREKAAAIRERTREKNVLYQREYRDKHRQELLDKKKQKYRDTHVMVPLSKYGHVSKHPDYNVWSLMKSRCMNANNVAYHHYGGRGIFVCDR